MESVLNLPELLWSILFRSNYDTILEYCRTHAEAQNICRSNLFWIQKAQHDFNIPPDVFNNTDLSPGQRYLQLLTQHGGVAKGSEIFEKLQELMQRAIQQNRSDLISYFIDLGFDNWEISLNEYAKLGNSNFVDYYLRLNPNYQVAAVGALEGNHQELFDYILSLAPVDYVWIWDDLMSAALRSQNIQLFNDVRSLVPLTYRLNWQLVVNNSLYLQNQDIFDYVLLLVPPNYPLNWTTLAGIALKYGNRELFDYILSSAPENYRWNWQLLAIHALESGYQNLFDYVRSLMPLNTNLLTTGLIDAAVDSGNQFLFDHVRSLFPNDKFNWNSLAAEALRSNHQQMFDYILLLNKDYLFDWNQLLEEATDNIYLFNHVFRLIPKDYQIDWNSILFRTIYSNNFYTFKYILKIASPNWDELLRRMVNNPKYFDYVLNSLPPNYAIDWNIIMLFTLPETIVHISSLVPSDYPFNWNEVIEIYAGSPILDQILRLVPFDYLIDWNEILLHIIRTHNSQTFKNLLDHVPPDYQINWSQIIDEARLGSSEFEDYILSLAPK